MKTPTLVLAALLLASCSKEEKSIRYEVQCTSCAVSYATEREWINTTVKGPAILDTTGITVNPQTLDTTYTVVTLGYVLTTWSKELDAADDFAPHLRTQILPGDHTTGRIYVNGVLTACDSTHSYGQEVSL